MNWVGSKRKYIDFVKKRLPKQWDIATQRYIDPFVGGGAIFFAISPEHAIISDAHEHLMSVYSALQTNSADFLKCLSDLFLRNSGTLFNSIKQSVFTETSDVTKAAAFFYMMHTALFSFICLSRDGDSYVAAYRQRKVDKPLRVPHLKFQTWEHCLKKDVRLSVSDFENTTRLANEGDFIFIDPPYWNEQRTDRKIYSVFTPHDHERLIKEVLRLDQLGCYIMLFNHDHPEILTAFSAGFNIVHIRGSKSSKFHNYREIMITNYDTGESRETTKGRKRDSTKQV